MALEEWQASFNKIYSRYQYRCRVRGIEFTIPKNIFKVICERNCVYCGAEPDNNSTDHQKRFKEAWKYNSLDRIDPSKGYTIDNVQPCCTMCNRFKSNFSEKEFIKKVIQIHSNLSDS